MKSVGYNIADIIPKILNLLSKSIIHVDDIKNRIADILCIVG
jgi:hypothetical protein